MKDITVSSFPSGPFSYTGSPLCFWPVRSSAKLWRMHWEMDREDVWTKIDDVLETLEVSTLVDDNRRASTRLGAASAMGSQQYNVSN